MVETTELELPATMHIETPQIDTAAPEPVERPLSPREIAMAKIVERRAEAYKAELDYGETLADDARETAGHEALSNASDDAPTPSPSREAATAPPAAPPIVEAPREHVVVVEGQPYRVTDEQMQHLASIGAIAIKAVQQDQQQPVPRQAVQPGSPQPYAVQPAPRQLLTPDEARAFSSKMQYGSEQESAQALSEMAQIIAARSVPAAPVVDPNQIARHVYQQVNQQAVLERNLNQIGAEYPEIFNNHTLSQLAALKLNEVRQRDRLFGIQKPDLDSYREACNIVRAELGSRAPMPQPAQEGANNPQSQAGANPIPATGARFAAKRAAPRQLATAGRVASSEQAPNRAPTASEIVNQMKRSRGQLPLQ